LLDLIINSIVEVFLKKIFIEVSRVFLKKIDKKESGE